MSSHPTLSPPYAQPIKNLDGTIDFFHLIAKETERQWSTRYFGNTAANVNEHSHRVGQIAIYLALKEGANPDRVTALAAFHDQLEHITVDLTPHQKEFITIDEDKALHAMLQGLHPVHATYLRELYAEYKARKTLESWCTKDADILDTHIELVEKAAHGMPILHSSVEQEHLIKKYSVLRTETARHVFNAILARKPEQVWDCYHQGESTFTRGTYGK